MKGLIVQRDFIAHSERGFMVFQGLCSVCAPCDTDRRESDSNRHGLSNTVSTESVLSNTL